MKLAIIAAIARNRVIGNKGTLPWHISEDLKRFKRLTTGHTVLMGRRTYESIGKPLPNRRNIVVTSSSLPGVETHSSIPAAIDAARMEDHVFVIGGERIFAAVLDSADELFLTYVDRDVEGDAFFPPYEELLRTRFREIRREDHEGYAFVDYGRI